MALPDDPDQLQGKAERYERLAKVTDDKQAVRALLELARCYRRRAKQVIDHALGRNSSRSQDDPSS